MATRIDPDDADTHRELGDIYGKSGMYEEAIEACKQAIRIDPDSALAHYNLGYFHACLNDRGSALEQYTILKHLDSELANKLYHEIYK
jgi:tetratricopeptide (TPR) repeat protein